MQKKINNNIFDEVITPLQDEIKELSSNAEVLQASLLKAEKKP